MTLLGIKGCAGGGGGSTILTKCGTRICRHGESLAHTYLSRTHITLCNYSGELTNIPPAASSPWLCELTSLLKKVNCVRAVHPQISDDDE